MRFDSGTPRVSEGASVEPPSNMRSAGVGSVRMPMRGATSTSVGSSVAGYRAASSRTMRARCWVRASWIRLGFGSGQGPRPSRRAVQLRPSPCHRASLEFSCSARPRDFPDTSTHHRDPVLSGVARESWRRQVGLRDSPFVTAIGTAAMPQPHRARRPWIGGSVL